MAQIDNYSPELVVLAGYMRVLGYSFVQHYLGRIINIHPSILPKYPGLNTHQRAIDAGDREHGASVHFVTEELDGGPIIMQAPVPIAESDSAVSLAKKVQEKENVIYPLVVKWFIEGRLKMKGKKAFLDGKPLNFPDHT